MDPKNPTRDGVKIRGGSLPELKVLDRSEPWGANGYTKFQSSSEANIRDKLGWNISEDWVHRIETKKEITAKNLVNKLGSYQLEQHRLRVVVDKGQEQYFYSYCIEGGTLQGLQMAVGAVFGLEQGWSLVALEKRLYGAGLVCVGGFPDF